MDKGIGYRSGIFPDPDPGNPKRTDPDPQHCPAGSCTDPLYINLGGGILLSDLCGCVWVPWVPWAACVQARGAPEPCTLGSAGTAGHTPRSWDHWYSRITVSIFVEGNIF